MLGQEIQLTILNLKIAYLEQLIWSIVKNCDKEKCVSKEYGFWSFDNETARNLIIFGVDNSLASHYDNRIKLF